MTVTISPKFQVVIPKKVREFLKLRPGMKVEVFAYDGRIELVPLVPIKEMRGICKGMNTDVGRDKEDRI